MTKKFINNKKKMNWENQAKNKDKDISHHNTGNLLGHV